MKGGEVTIDGERVTGMRWMKEGSERSRLWNG